MTTYDLRGFGGNSSVCGLMVFKGGKVPGRERAPHIRHGYDLFGEFIDYKSSMTTY